jgi:hypothetical protein
MPQRASVDGVPAHETFKSYIHVEGEFKVPSGITLFAATGGRWNVIDLPDELVDLPLAEQMPAMETLMRAYLDKYKGQCPFFGRVRGFRLVRMEDSLRFSPDGKFIEPVVGPYHSPCAELRIGNKAVESMSFRVS